MAIPHTLEIVKLKNGSEGVFVNAPGAPVSAYSIQFRAGSDNTSRAYPFQIAHILEHIIEAGPDSPTFPRKSDYLHEVQKNGAWRNAYTGEFGINYIGDCTPDELMRILKLRLSATENPKLNENILKSESGNVQEEMRQRVADYTRLSNALSRKVLSNGAWQTSIEALTEAKNVTIESVKEYYRKTHTAGNLRFIIVGDIDNIKGPIVELFDQNSLADGPRLEGPVTIPARVETYSYEHRSGLENLFTNFALAIPRQLNPRQVAAMQLINNLLCNSWDSRILGKAREAGLCYSMRGYIEQLKTQTIWMFDTPIGPNNAREFFLLMSSALTDLSTKGPTNIELQKAKAFIVGQSKKNGQTTQELLNMYSEEYFGLDSLSSAKERIDCLESVSTEDVSILIKEFILSESKVFSGVGAIDEVEFEEQFNLLIKNLKI
jgi:predicted Zn-dependent peptidase